MDMAAGLLIVAPFMPESERSSRAEQRQLSDREAPDIGALCG
jgi:hypothetical protein